MNRAANCPSILVLCEGNLCRSPMAAGLLREALGPAFPVASAGLAALVGRPPDPEAVRLMAACGLDIARQRSRQLTPAIALAADIILVMDPGQKDWCTSLVPAARGRVYLLGHWRQPPAVIEDPYGRGPEVFAAAFDAIRQCVSDWVPQLLTKRRSA